MSKIQVDSLIHASWIAPVRPQNVLLKNHALVVDSGAIIALLDSKSAEHTYEAKETFQLEEHLLTPGLINAHGHTAMTLFRGLADDLPLSSWLNDHIWPAEARWVGEEFVADGSELAIAEMLLTGTTCFSDMYFFPNITAQIAHRHKLRAQVMMPVLEFPSAWAANADEYIHKGLNLYDQYRNHELINIGFGPHAPYTVGDQALERIRMLANELDATIHIHLHETAQEVADAMQLNGERPLQRLQRLDLLSPRLQTVHMTCLDDQDILLLQEYGCHVVHCPESNLKLASGFCPVARLLEQGVNVALGTDGAASNNDLNLLAEAKTAALIAKAVSCNASNVSAYQALAMATYQGALALGLENEIGSLEVNKSADIVAFDLSRLSDQPVYDPISQLIYGEARQASQVWVKGQLLVNSGQLTQFDLKALKQRINSWRDRIGTSENQRSLGL